MNWLLECSADALTSLLMMFIPGLLLVVLMNLVSKRVQTSMIRIFGIRGYLIIFGCIGTSVHELSHALMCVVFCHKIKSIKWFSGIPGSGTLGQVRHTYDKGSFYQRFGCAFISIAPLFGGSFILFVTIRIFMPGLLVPVNFSNSVVDLVAQTFLFTPIQMSCTLFAPWHFLNLSFYLMLYIIICIGSSIHMSKADLGNFFSTLPIFLPFIFAMGFVLSIADTFLESNLWQFATVVVFHLYTLLIMATIISLFTLVLISLVSILSFRSRSRFQS